MMLEEMDDCKFTKNHLQLVASCGDFVTLNAPLVFGMTLCGVSEL